MLKLSEPLEFYVSSVSLMKPYDWQIKYKMTGAEKRLPPFAIHFETHKFPLEALVKFIF